VVPAQILHIGALHFHIEASRRVRRTGATVVDSLSIRIKHDSPTGLMEALRPVDVLTVHEEFLVQQANLINRLPSKHPKPASETLDVRYSVIVEAVHLKVTKQSASTKHPVYCQGSAKPIPHGWKPKTGLADASVRKNHLRTQHADIRVLVHERCHPFQASAANLYV